MSIDQMGRTVEDISPGALGSLAWLGVLAPPIIISELEDLSQPLLQWFPHLTNRDENSTCLIG